MDKKKTCFVIAPVGAAGSPQRERADFILTHIFKQALEPMGYTVIRADEICPPEVITPKVIQNLWESYLVIVDLTDHDANVFYESGYRDALQKPMLSVIASGQKAPFEGVNFRTIEIGADADGADRARQELIAQTEGVETYYQFQEKQALVTNILNSKLKTIKDGLLSLDMEKDFGAVPTLKFVARTARGIEQTGGFYYTISAEQIAEKLFELINEYKVPPKPKPGSWVPFKRK